MTTAHENELRKVTKMTAKKKAGRPVTEEMTARRDFIEKWAACPDVSFTEIAKAVGCTPSYVTQVAKAAGQLEERERRRVMNATKMQRSMPKILLPHRASEQRRNHGKP